MMPIRSQHAQDLREHHAWMMLGYSWLCWYWFAVGPAEAIAQVPSLPPRDPVAIIQEQVPQALRIRDRYMAIAPAPSKRTLHLVLWTPSDREPIEGFQERLSRVMLDIQAFYRSEMERMGFGPMTFWLDMETEHQVRIHVVRGKSPYDQYNVGSGDRIRRECLSTLREAGIDADRETIVIFCNMSQWDPVAMTMRQNSPYYAAGGLRQGTAWQVDSALLDAKRLNEREPFITDGQYGRISVGRYNSIFVGGVCHELGHALGLPHSKERPDEARAMGTSLMGSGNRTYGEERRQEGRGSAFTLADGLRLAGHPLLKHDDQGIDLPPNATLSNLSLELTENQREFIVRGRVTADPPAYAVIGYLDPQGGGDYDATTTTAVPDDNGDFELRCDPSGPVASAALRIVVCQSNGGRIDDRVLAIPYSVDADGRVDIERYRNVLQLQHVVAAVRERDQDAAKRALRSLEDLHRGSDPPPMLWVARSLVRTMEPPKPRPLSEVQETRCWLSDFAPSKARVGWLSPMYDRIPEDAVALSIGGKLFAHGIYAHAPSLHEYRLDRRWNRITGNVGIADNHDGSCVFVVQADGIERWRSPVIRAGDSHPLDVALDNVERLELRVEDGGDGNGADWGLWTDVELHR